ncbi:MAG: selenoneine synthase SenA [Aquabacterium sp.]
MQIDTTEGTAIRHAGRAALAAALAASRVDTLRTFDAYVQALGAPDVAVPYRADINPPLWELGHIGWFQEFWIGRNPQRSRGAAADPEAQRPDSLRACGDALYNSSHVAHASRWHLPLPGIAATRDDLARQGAQTQALLAAEPDESDATLYFYRLALAHEDMHHEAAVYMARTLGFDLPDARWQPATLGLPTRPLDVPAGAWSLGHDGPGFQFDNERRHQPADGHAYAIDSQVVRWAEWRAFVADGGYSDARLWTPQGWHWRQATGRDGPRALRRDGVGVGDSGWQLRTGAGWAPLDEAGRADQAACHISQHEALAYCAWAGRRLPTEAEWERAAHAHPADFQWGQVWEWTASAFAPFTGFEPHPYRDYSQPWFDGRPVLKGGAWATQPRMKHPRYRNFFTADRTDIVAGLRTCARHSSLIPSRTPPA